MAKINQLDEEFVAKRAAYHLADEDLREAREAWRRRETGLMIVRDRRLRDMVGSQWGGVAAASRILGISDAQIFRLMDDGITRVAHEVLDQLVGRDNYQLCHQRGGRTIGVVLANHEQKRIVVEDMSKAGLDMIMERRVSTASSSSMVWSKIKNIKLEVERVLTENDISTRTYKLTGRRGEHAVRLTLRAVVSSLGYSVLEQFAEILANSGVGFRVVVDDTSLLISDIDEIATTVEMVFGWA